MLNIAITILTAVILAAVFYLYPNLDIDVSAHFYSPESGFFLKDKFWVLAIYNGVKLITILFVVIAAALLLKTFLKTKSLKPRYYRNIIFVTLVCLIGPGFIVHNIFKDHFGRPRPHQVEQFGGVAHFQKPFMISSECSQNCSFPSGHASVGFMFISLAMLYKGYKRKAITALSIFLGLGIGFIRIVQGGHFLSDVMFAGVVVFLTAYILEMMFKQVYMHKE
ncbi:MAG: phosphatase PAP2 family protein [Alphaproteobacteria bacterium]|jgi:lipid A 4'-phosphatase|nr:phosphatase PAP2 family protein [Candidatus Jidaibacter sp.]